MSLAGSIYTALVTDRSLNNDVATGIFSALGIINQPVIHIRKLTDMHKYPSRSVSGFYNKIRLGRNRIAIWHYKIKKSRMEYEPGLFSVQQVDFFVAEITSADNNRHMEL